MEFNILDWKKGEGLFVAGVLLVVLGVSVVQVRIGEAKTRDAQRKADANLVSRAISAYFGDHRVYPASDNGRIVACGFEGEEVCEWGGGPVIDADGVVYLQKIPVEPFSNRGWKYVYESDGKNFRIYAKLEREKKVDLTIECGNHVECNWYAN